MSDQFSLSTLSEEQLHKKLFFNLDSEIVAVIKEINRREVERLAKRLELNIKEIYDLAKVQGHIAALRKLDSLLSPPSHSGAAPSYEA